jgi:heavy metal efflux system protein
MIEAIIRFSLRRRVLVAAGVAALIGLGVWSFMNLPVEAFPDLTANQVLVLAEAPGLPAEEVEQLVTFPVERGLLGLPGTVEVRSFSRFGLSVSQVIFQDRVDTYFARQLVSERLAQIGGELPPGVSPVLGPVATAMGEVYQYILVSTNDAWDLPRLRTLHDQSIAPQLRVVPGVAEVNAWGGWVEQVHVVVSPERLAADGITLADVEAALVEADVAFGGGYVESGSERLLIRGLGRLPDLAALEDVPVAWRGDGVLRVGDLARVTMGALPREGAVTHNGNGEVVSGMVIMRKGENARRVIAGTRSRLAEIQGSLPEGVEVLVFYDQSRLVDRTTDTLRKNLLLGGTLVILVIWGFLRNIRASLIVAVLIPLSMLWAFTAMRWWGFSANLMSLGALDFGLLVDGGVVMVENIMRRARGEEGETPAQARARVRDAALEVGRPIVFGISIVAVVYLPIFALQGTAGKLFTPMAFVVMMALLGSLVLALTFVPAASLTHLARAREVHTPGFQRFRLRYEAFLRRTLPRAIPLGIAAGVVVVATALSATRIGTEFMPRLDEGDILVQALRLPSTGMEAGNEYSRQMEVALMGLPEVVQVVSKLGRPELATETMGLYESDAYVILRPRGEWRRGGRDALLAAMDSALATVPGVTYALTQPIQMRLDEAETGITTDVGLKIFGDDPDRLATLAGRAEVLLATVPGAADVLVSSAARILRLQVDPDREVMGRLGLSMASLAAQVEGATGQRVVTHLVEGPRRIGVAVQVEGGSRLDPERMALLPISLPSGGIVPLGAVADLRVEETPEELAHEGGRRLVVVGTNVRGRDVGSFVAAASRTLAGGLDLPEGYTLEWGGQYTQQRRAALRLAVLGPVALAAIFLLLLTAFGRIRQAVLIMLNVPFALVGGVLILWATGLTLSTSAMVGFIAVFGIATLNGVVMVTFINQLRDRGVPVEDAVVQGAGIRLRPVLMTALTNIIGFLPMAVSWLPGAELQRPLATVVIGGALSSLTLTLLLLPTLYLQVERWFGARDESWSSP